MGRVFLLILLFLAVSAGAAVLYGRWQWGSTTDRLHEQLRATRVPIVPAVYCERDLEGLPGPVQRYFRAVLKDGQPLIAAARLVHTGTFNVGETKPNWRPFSSRQLVTTRRPGFVWDARVAMAPGLPIFVHDAYVAGKGVLHAEALGLITVADVQGTSEVARGELLRYLAEAMWYPTALLPSQGVVWTPIDELSARATLQDGTTVASLDFRFRADGLLESTFAAARPRTLAGNVGHAPWTGRGWHYELHDDMQIPVEAEVEWREASGAYPYWRGRIIRIEYEYVDS